jgi:hypothetical protein
MKVRSPVLGYNHNVRYAERLWHVQTEDSGVQNPHIFTHLFHDGTILATKRLDYDPSSEVIAVQKLMQTQHKAMLRELKAGAFDEKISKFLGVAIAKKAAEPEPTAETPAPAVAAEPATFDASPAPEPSAFDATAPTELATPESGAPYAEMSMSPSTELSLSTSTELSEPRPLEGPLEPFDEPPTDRTSVPPLETEPRGEESAPTQESKGDTDRKLTVPPASRPSLTPLRPTAPARPPLPPLRPPVRPASTPSARAVPRQPSGIGGRRPASGAAAKSAEGVVVARPAVIVGGGSSPARPPSQAAKAQPGRSSGRWHPAPAPAPAPPAVDKSAQDNIFGGDLISEKSLDEVILAYLSEDLNDK